MGTGHVMRCLALATAWRRATGGRVVLLTAADVGPLAGRIAAAGVEVRTVDVPSLAPGFGSAEDAHATAAVGAQRGGVLARARRLRLRRRVPAGRGRRPRRPCWCWTTTGTPSATTRRCVLNQNFGADARPYAASLPPERLLLGPRYALVREEFLPAPPPRPATPVGVPHPRHARRLRPGQRDDDGRARAGAGAHPGPRGDRRRRGRRTSTWSALRAAVAALGDGCRLVVDSRDMPALMAARRPGRGRGRRHRARARPVRRPVAGADAGREPAPGGGGPRPARHRRRPGLEPRRHGEPHRAGPCTTWPTTIPAREQMASSGRYAVDGLGADRGCVARDAAGRRRPRREHRPRHRRERHARGQRRARGCARATRSSRSPGASTGTVAGHALVAGRPRAPGIADALLQEHRPRARAALRRPHRRRPLRGRPGRSPIASTPSCPACWPRPAAGAGRG